MSALSAADRIPSPTAPGIKKVEQYRGWTVIVEHTLSGRHVFSALKMDGWDCLGYILEASSRDEVMRIVDDREGRGA